MTCTAISREALEGPQRQTLYGPLIPCCAVCTKSRDWRRRGVGRNPMDSRGEYSKNAQHRMALHVHLNQFNERYCNQISNNEMSL